MNGILDTEPRLRMDQQLTHSLSTIHSSNRIAALMSFLSNSCSDWVAQVSIIVLATSPFLDINPQRKLQQGLNIGGGSVTSLLFLLHQWFNCRFYRKFERIPFFPASRQLCSLFGAAVWGWMRCGLAAEQQRTSASPRSFPRDCRPFMGNAGVCILIRRTRCKSQPLWSIGETSVAFLFYVVARYAHIKTS